MSKKPLAPRAALLSNPCYTAGMSSMDAFEKVKRGADRRKLHAKSLGMDESYARMLTDRRKTAPEILRDPEEQELFAHFLEKNHPGTGEAVMTATLDSTVAPSPADVATQALFVQEFNERMSLAEGITSKLSDTEIEKIMSAMEETYGSTGTMGSMSMFLAAMDTAPRAEAGKLLRLTIKRIACEEPHQLDQLKEILAQLLWMEQRKESSHYKKTEARLAKVSKKYDVSASTLAPLFDPTDPEAEKKRKAYISKQVGLLRTLTGSARRNITKAVTAVHELQELMDEDRQSLGEFLSNTLLHRGEFLHSIQNVAAGVRPEVGQTDPAFQAQAPATSVFELSADNDDALVARWNTEKEDVAKSLGFRNFAAATAPGARAGALDTVRNEWFAKEEARRKRGGAGFWGRIFNGFFGPRKAAIHSRLT